MKQLFDSELKVMEPLWNDGPQTAAELVRRLTDSCGWNKNTTYTVIKSWWTKRSLPAASRGFSARP